MSSVLPPEAEVLPGPPSSAVPAPKVDVSSIFSEGEKHLQAGRASEAEACALSVLGSQPAFPGARLLLGRSLLAQGRTAQAADQLITALQNDDKNAALWFAIACATRRNNRPKQAIQALEGCLRVDPRFVEGWFMLAELASEFGNGRLRDDALGMARQLAPEDSRVAGWKARLADRGSPGPSGTPTAGTRHILLYSDDPEFGGVAQWNHNILIALASKGYRVTCVQTRCESPLVKERLAAGITHRWLDYDTGKDFARTLTDRSHADAIFAADRPDLVLFADCCPLSNLAARQAAMDREIPFVTVVHFAAEYLARNFAPFLPTLARQHAAARAVVSVSGENLGLLHRHFGTPAAQGVVIHNGRPPCFFSPRDAAVRKRLRAEQGIPEGAVVCFTAARLTAVKGFAYQLEAIKLLKGKSALGNLYFVWAGDGDLRSSLTRQLAELQVGDHVRILGHRWDVADWYDAADIFILSSELEGMPLSIMEAMAKGLPVVATAVSGTPEELGDTGKLLPNPAKDPRGVARELAQTVELWAGTPALREEQGRLCRERAERMFRESLMVERITGLLAKHVAAA